MVIGGVGEKMLDPRPALADGVGDMLREISAVAKLTMSSRPSASIAMWRLWRLIFAPAGNLCQDANQSLMTSHPLQWIISNPVEN